MVERKMKITKQQLKQIIKEELNEIRASGLGTFGPEYPDFTSDLGPGGKTELQEAVAELANIIVKLTKLHDRMPKEPSKNIETLALERNSEIHQLSNFANYRRRVNGARKTNA